MSALGPAPSSAPPLSTPPPITTTGGVVDAPWFPGAGPKPTGVPVSATPAATASAASPSTIRRPRRRTGGSAIGTTLLTTDWP